MGAVDPTEWACVLCGRHIQNDWVSRATNLHQILCQAWTFLPGNYSDDSEGRSWGQLMIGSFIMTRCPLMPHVSCRVFWWNTKSTSDLAPPYSPDSAPCNFWLFPKWKSFLKGKSFQNISKIQENTVGQLIVIGGTVWGPKVPSLKETEGSLSCTEYYMAGYLLEYTYFHTHIHTQGFS